MMDTTIVDLVRNYLSGASTLDDLEIFVAKIEDSISIEDVRSIQDLLKNQGRDINLNVNLAVINGILSRYSGKDRHAQYEHLRKIYTSIGIDQSQYISMILR